MSAGSTVHPKVSALGQDPGVDGPIRLVEGPSGVADRRPALLRRGYRFELMKQLTQWRLRLVLAACWLVPAVLVAVVGHQSSLPSDTVFGRWMGQTGWAGPLVVLSFCCSWVLPLLTSLVAGDVFAAEDRLGTWRHLLIAVRSPRRIFIAKTLASLTVLLALVVGLAVSALVGGVTAVGSRPLVGLGGQLIASHSAAALVVLAWATVLAPTLAFAAVGLLGSVTFGRSPLGLLTPVVLAFVLDLAQLLPLPVVARLALPSWSFLAWRGLFTDKIQTGPILIGVAVDLVWAAVAAALAYRIFLRRDFTDPAYDGAGPRVLMLTGAALLALVALTGRRLGPVRAVELGHRPAEARALRRDGLRPPVSPANRRAAPAGGNRGRARDNGRLRQGRRAGRRFRARQRLALHRVLAPARHSRRRNCDLPARRHRGRALCRRRRRASIGQRLLSVRTPTGDVPNPLWQFDGSVDLLTTTPKG